MKNFNENLLNQALESRKYHKIKLLKTQDRFQRKIYNHFCIFSKSIEKDPVLISIYPSNTFFYDINIINSIKDYCFPVNCHEFFKNSNCFLKQQLIFRFLEKERTNYGVCIHFNINKLFPPFFVNENNLNDLFCFIFLTSNPIFSTHFQFLLFLLHFITTNTVSNFTFKSQLIFNDQILPFENLKNFNGISLLPDFKPYKKFYRLLFNYYNLNILKNTEQKIKLNSFFELKIPKFDYDYNLGLITTIDVLFSFVSINHIIKIFFLLILEFPLILISYDLRKLTFSMISLKCLLSPFQISSIFLPIIPNKSEYLTLIESPIPIFCGLHKVSLNLISIPNSINVFDLDNGHFIQNSFNLNIPYLKDFQNRLNNVLDLFGNNSKILNNKSFNNSFYFPFYFEFLNQKYFFNLDFINKIHYNLSYIFISNLLNILIPCYVTDITDNKNTNAVINMEIFLNSIPIENIQFYQTLSSSSCFIIFCDMIANILENKKKKSKYFNIQEYIIVMNDENEL